MPAFDYWDIDDILSEQLEVSAKSEHSIIGGAILSKEATGLKDLPEGAKVQLPFWLARGFMRRNWAMNVDLPLMFSPTVIEDLQRDPTIFRLADKWPYYFELGMRIAPLMEPDPLKNEAWRKLQVDLMTALQSRWKEVVKTLSQMFAPRTQFSRGNPDVALFPSTLTYLENEMLSGGREAEKQFQRWIERFGVQQMLPSPLVEAPVKKARHS